ncbi:hypothetical protein BH24ACT5_BH24ACT5_28930 [soil metagenome]
MASLIHYLADRREIHLGDVTFTGDVALDGRVTMAGHIVRPLTLAERDQLVGRTIGPDRAGRIARLVGDAAAPGGEHLPDDARAAVDAVALDLAGASLAGPLSRTLLLVARAMGGPSEAVMTMSARDADELAATLGRALTDATRSGAASTDNGWTTIAYPAGPAPGGEPAGSTNSTTSTVEAVRDRLAAQLVARAEQPLDPDEVAVLLGTDLPDVANESSPEPATPWTGAGTTTGDDHGDRWQTDGADPIEPVATADRWRDAIAALGSSTGLDTARPSVGTHDKSAVAAVRAAGGGDASATVPADAVTALASSHVLDPSTRSAEPVGGSPAHEPAPAPSVRSGPRRGPGALGHGHIGSTRHPRPHPPLAPAAIPPSALRTHRDPVAGPTHTPTRPSDPSVTPGGRAIGSAPGSDLTAAAVALHEAADRRGLPR